MTVYVDDALIPWVAPRANNPMGRTWRMSHMFADSTEELHAFARKLGLMESWFQCPPKASWEHYDVTKAKRQEAIKRGAVPIPFRAVPDKLREMGRR